MPSLVCWPVYIIILKLYFVKHDAPRKVKPRSLNRICIQPTKSFEDRPWVIQLCKTGGKNALCLCRLRCPREVLPALLANAHRLGGWANRSGGILSWDCPLLLFIFFLLFFFFVFNQLCPRRREHTVWLVGSVIINFKDILVFRWWHEESVGLQTAQLLPGARRLSEYIFVCFFSKHVSPLTWCHYARQQTHKKTKWMFWVNEALCVKWCQFNATQVSSLSILFNSFSTTLTLQ